MEKTVKGILLDQEDNVVTVIQAVHAGMTVCWDYTNETDAEAQTEVPRFHKIAIVDIKKGGVIKKYGQAIGVATKPIPKGTHVHTQNCVGTAVEEIHK